MQTTFRHNFMHWYERNAEKSRELMFATTISLIMVETSL